MKKNKNIFGLIMIAVFLTVIVSVSPIKNVIKRVLNDISGATDNHVYLTASFKYLDKDNSPVDSNDKIYVFLTKENNGQERMVTFELAANGAQVNVTKIYDQNGTEQKGELEGTYYVKVAVPKNGQQPNKVSEKDRFDGNKYDVYENDGTYNGSYIINYESEIEIKIDKTVDLNIEVNERDGERLSSGVILSKMNLATNFGVFARTLMAGPDMESTIAVEEAEKIDNNFGLSEKNYKYLKNFEKGKIVVNKVFTKNKIVPVVNKDIKIKLTKTDEDNVIKTGTCKTSDDGRCNVSFDNLDEGIYTISEEIEGKQVTSNETITTNDEKIEVSFSDTDITILESGESDKSIYNYNYVGKAKNNVNAVQLHKMRGPGTLVVNDENLYNSYKEKSEFKNEGKEINLINALNDSSKKIDFETEFTKLKELSVNLSSAIDSNDVKVHYIDYKKIENAELDFNSDNKEYILINVDCTNANEVKIGGRHKRNGKVMVTEEDSFEYNEAAKVIYNFYVTENGIVKPYDKSIKTEGATTGIILAPDADVEGASSNHSGTIIAKKYNHVTGEVHQKVNFEKINSSSINTSIINNIIEEEKKEQDVSIGKVDANNNPIEGAELQLLNSSNEVVDSWTSTTELHKVTEELTIGESYTIHEVKAPTGYQIAKDYTFTYDEKTITYYMVDTKVIVSKFDEGQTLLPGATLQILDKDGEVIEEWITDGKEHYVNYQLKLGETYILHEEKAPEGYKKAEDVKFVYAANDKDQTVEMKDQKIVIGVFVEKKNMNDELLSGAHLQVLDSNGTILDDWISEGTVHRVNTELEIGGKYTLHEEAAPEGYEVSPDVSFEVKNTEDNQIVTMFDNKIIIPGEPYVKIRKEDKDGKLLEGAELQLLDSEGNVLEEWTSNDKEHIVDTKLEVGKQYTLHEKTAPKGYEKAEDITFVAQENEQEIKMIDKRIKKVAGIVETLDKITKYVTIFAITLSLLLLGLYTYRKLNKRYTE